MSDNTNGRGMGFPSHTLDSSQKDEKWIAQYIKAAWTEFTSYYPNQMYNGRDKYHEIKLYMNGNQSISRYKKLLQPREVANEDQSWININWDILPIIPKFRRIALSTLIKSNYDISIDAIDPMAQDDKDNFYKENAAKIMLRDEFQKQGMDKGEIPAPEIEAESITELDMYMNYSYKHRMAIELEQAIQLIMNLNKFDTERQRVIEDVHDLGMGGYKEYFDAGGNIKIRRVNPMNLIMSYTVDPTFKDIQYIGEVNEYTLPDLRQLAGSQLTEDQYITIAEKFINSKANPGSARDMNSSYDKNYDGFRIKVLDIEFFSYNSIVLEERINSKGNKVVGRAAKIKNGKGDKKYTKTDYKVVYQGKWVIGSDIFFDCKMATNMKRAKSSMTDTTLSYHIVAPHIYQMSTYSLGDQMKSIADQIQLAWYKLQNVMLRARPRGIMIELGALENVPLGKAGRALKPMEIIDLYNQTGNLVYRRLDDQGQASNYKPIEELNNGIGSEATEYFNIIKQNIDLLRDILGFNEITDGSTPDPRMLNGVAQYASESTNNSLDFIKRAERDLMERLCYDLTLRIQDSAASGMINGYVRALGSGTVQFFKIDPNVSAYECGLIIKETPNKFEQDKFSRRVEQAIATNQITLADAMMVENLTNIKYAEVLLAYKIKKNQEDAQRRAMETQQMNGQIQMQSAQAAEQAKQQTMAMEAQLKERYLQMEKTLESQLLAMKLQNEAMIEQGKIAGKIDTAKIESDSREYVAQIKTSSEKLKQSSKEKAK